MIFIKVLYGFNCVLAFPFLLQQPTYFDADHSERAFYKELVKVIEASDVILEVLDARDPLGSRCLDMEKMVLKAGPEKHLVLLLNKIGMFLLSTFLIIFWNFFSFFFTQYNFVYFLELLIFLGRSLCFACN